MMRLSKFHNMLNSSDIMKVASYLQTFPHDPVYEVVLESILVPQLPGDPPRILWPFECATLAVCLADLGFSPATVTAVLEYVPVRTFESLLRKQQFTLLEYLLAHSCWSSLDRFVDATKLPPEWFDRYVHERILCLRKKLCYAEEMLQQGHNIMLLMYALEAFAPDSAHVKLLYARAWIAEYQPEKALSILESLMKDPQVWDDARHLFAYVQDNYRRIAVRG